MLSPTPEQGKSLSFSGRLGVVLAVSGWVFPVSCLQGWGSHANRASLLFALTAKIAGVNHWCLVKAPRFDSHTHTKVTQHNAQYKMTDGKYGGGE
jgi:hypothetical protein